MFVSTTRDRITELLRARLSLAEFARRTGLAYTTVSYHRDRIERSEGDSSARQAIGATSSEDPEHATYLRPIATREEVRRLLRAGHSRAAVARELAVSKGTVTYHARWIGLQIDARAARRYDWTVIQRYYDAGHSVDRCRAKFGFSKASWTGAVRRGDVVARAKALPIDELLAASQSRANLKRRLIKEGVLPARCASCGITGWRGRPLALQLHHINGDRHDNRLENLALLCPNCHSQTNTWAGRNGGARRGAAAAG
jgi:DNA-binding CsgD family transcriptional regulator